MKFYKVGKNGYCSLANVHSRHWEIHKGWSKFPCWEVTRISTFGFGWDTEGKKYKEIFGSGLGEVVFTKSQFIGWLIDRRHEYEYQLKKINQLIIELNKK